MTVLITGGISKISTQLAEAVLKNGRNVVLLHNNEAIPTNLINNPSLTLINLSSINEEAIKNLIENYKIQTIFDASLTTTDVLLEPIQGAKKLILGITSILDAIRKSASPPSLVLISGDEVYGRAKNRVETQPLEPVTFIGSAQMSVEAMAHSYAVSYRIPMVIGRVSDDLSISDATRGLLAIEKLAQSQKPAEVYNISASSAEKIQKETNWSPSGSVKEQGPIEEVFKPIFLVFGANSELKTQFLELLKLEGLVSKESTITNLQEATDKSVIDEINTINPSHLVYFGNETDSFEGDCFTLRTNMATNLYFPWLLASIAEKFSLHFTHFGNTSMSQESSALAVKGYTGKMLEYFEKTLIIGQKIDKNVLESIKACKTGGLNNNI